MSDLIRLLNMAAQLYSHGQGDAELVLAVGTLRVPLRLIGFDDVRNQVALEMIGSRDRESR